MKHLIPILILVVVVGGGYYWWSVRPSTAAPEPATLSGSGTIEAETVAITAELGGRILEIMVDEGDEVEAGQLLVELDEAALLARQAQLEAALTTAKVNLELASAPARPEDIAAAEALLEQAQVAQQGAALTWDRAQKLADDPHELEAMINQAKAEVTVAESELESARVQLKQMEIQAEAASRNQSDHAALVQQEVTQYQLQAAQTGVQMAEVALAGAQQQVDHFVQIREQPLSLIAQAHAAGAAYHQAEAGTLAAEANLVAVKAGPAQEDIAVAQAQVAEAEAALVVVQAQLAKQSLAAPRAGLISRRLVEPGELAAPGATLLELSDLDQVDLTIYIPETAIGQVSLGQPAWVYVDAYPGEIFKGVVTFIEHEAEFTPRNVQTQEERVNLVFGVKISLDNPDHRLKPGMPADAEILPQLQPNSDKAAGEALPARVPTERVGKAVQTDIATPTAQSRATAAPTVTSAPEPDSLQLEVTPGPATSTPPETETISQVEITTWALKAHSGPGVTYPVVAYLAQGTVAPVLQIDETSGWLQVQLPDSKQTGWITNNPAYVSIR